MIQMKNKIPIIIGAILILLLILITIFSVNNKIINKEIKKLN